MCGSGFSALRHAKVICRVFTNRVWTFDELELFRARIKFQISFGIFKMNSLCFCEFYKIVNRWLHLQSVKMNGVKLRRFLQTLFIMLLVAYTTLFAYQSLSHAAINNQVNNCLLLLSNIFKFNPTQCQCSKPQNIQTAPQKSLRRWLKISKPPSLPHRFVYLLELCIILAKNNIISKSWWVNRDFRSIYPKYVNPSLKSLRSHTI